MFLGTTPAPVRDYLAGEIRKQKPVRMFEPCAGNFVMSLVCGAINKEIKVISGDVSIYSVAVGGAFNDSDTGIRLNEAAKELYPFFKGKDSPMEVAATVLLWDELAKCLPKRHVRYYDNIAIDIESNLEKYLKGIIAKLTKAKASLGDFTFYAQDACVTIQDAAGPDDMVLYDPPYWEGGYEKLYEQMVSHFEVPEIPYTVITDELKQQHLQELAARGARTFFRAEDPIEVDGYKTVYEYLYKPNGKRYFLLTNLEATPSHGWRRMLRTKRAKYDVLWGKELEPTMKAEMIPVGSDIGNYYQQLWTKKATMRDAGEMWLFVIGGRVCGVVAIMCADRYGHKYATIVADAAPLGTPYRRLGRLVLYGILTEQFLEMANKRLVYPHESFTTKAYTDNPVSMKYRGLLELVDRSKGGPGEHKYILTYRSKTLKRKTVQQAFEDWFKQYGSDVNE